MGLRLVQQMKMGLRMSDQRKMGLKMTKQWDVDHWKVGYW